MYPVTIGLLTLAAAVGRTWLDLGRAGAARAALFLIYFAIAFAYPAGIGLGDVKLSGILGMFLGWPHVVLGTVAAFLLNALVALVLLAMGRTTL
jgi:leader peptidase (prepilin peptidase) / N-methyltransferase